MFKKTIIMTMISLGLLASTALAQQQISPVYYTIDEPDHKNNSSDFETYFFSEDFTSLGTQVIKSVAVRFYNLVRFKLHNRALVEPTEPYIRRDHFGRWVNDPTDDTCWNTRAKILIRDSSKPVVFRNEKNCIVDSGEWDDKFTGLTFKEAKQIQVDHTVPLKHAFVMGASKWDFKARCLFSNFIFNNYHLAPVYGRENMSKGDRGPDGYLPPNPQYTCEYLKNWLKVKLAWRLALTDLEVEAIEETMKEAGCSASSMRMSNTELKNVRDNINSNLNYCFLNRRQ